MQDFFVEQPVFLVGAERSGTTLLRLMLGHHSQLAWCNEFEYVVDLISDKGEFPELDTYYQWLEIHRIFQATKFKIDTSLNYPQLVNSFLIQKQTNESKYLIGATVHRHFDKLLTIWPQARFIHIVRDGRDVSRSCIGMGWAGNVWTGVERWIQAENLWSKLSQSLSDKQKIEIRYEALISQPSNVLKCICDFIGISFETEMLTYNQTTTYNLPNPKLIQQWKNRLSEQEVQLVESRINQMLLERNYETSGLPALKVSSTMQLVLKIQDWVKRTEFRIKRLGLPLVLADNLSRRLRIKSWQKNIKLKINTIQQSYLK